MASTGDGLTPETAIFALGPVDGQNFIYKYTRSGIGLMGSGKDKDGNFLDILTAVKTNKTTGEKMSTTMYFNVQHAVKKMFDPGTFDDVEKSMKSKKKSLK